MSGGFAGEAETSNVKPFSLLLLRAFRVAIVTAHYECAMADRAPFSFDRLIQPLLSMKVEKVQQYHVTC